MMNKLSPYGYAKTDRAFSQRLFGLPFVAIASHWVFQSILYMDTTERIFKLLVDVVLTIPIALFFWAWMPSALAIMLALVIAHTLNFLFNGQLWGILKHYGYVTHTFAEFFQYLQGFSDRLTNEQAFSSAVIIGGLSREIWAPNSDLDIRLIRLPGIKNGILASFFTLKERTRALYHKFPIDIYVFDSRKPLFKNCSDESFFTLQDVIDRFQENQSI